MLNDPDVRNVEEVTNGDFLAFELFDGKEWAEVHIALPVLAEFGAAEQLSAVEAFERNLEKIKGAAFSARNVGHGRISLSADSFRS